jgi:hypothetical protein
MYIVQQPDQSGLPVPLISGQAGLGQGFMVDIQVIRPNLWQEPDELLMYLQIETKYFRLMIQKVCISLTPGPDLACNAYAVLPGLINNIEIAIFAKEVAPGRAGQA